MLGYIRIAPIISFKDVAVNVSKHIDNLICLQTLYIHQKILSPNVGRYSNNREFKMQFLFLLIIPTQ